MEDPFFHGLIIDDLDWVGMPNGIVGGVSSTGPGVVTFSDHQVRVNWQGENVGNGQETIITIQHGKTSSVPEPTTTALIALGLLAMRRRITA